MNPIYQMIFEANVDTSIGLIFSEETEDFNQPVFVMPTKDNKSWWTENYYLPGEVNGKQKNFELSFENSFLVLKDSELDHAIRFGIGYYNPYYRTYSGYRPPLILEEFFLKYIGKHKDLVYPYDRFIILNPLDLLVMDYLYYKHKACFVGLTPVFGDTRELR